MMRRLTALTIAALLLSACGGTAPALREHGHATAGQAAPQDLETDPAALHRLRPVSGSGSPQLPATVTGADGVDVTVTDTSRLVVLNGGVGEIVWSLGFGPRVVARDATTTFPEAGNLPTVTHGHDLSVEGVLALEPSLVLADERVGPPEAIGQIRGAGVPVVRIADATTLEDISARIQAVAAALGVPAAGRALARRTMAEIDAARSQDGPPLRVAFLYLRGSASVYLLGGEGSGADALVQALGHIDVGTELGLGPFTPLTSEAMIAAAPDVLLVMEQGLRSVDGVEGLVQLAGIAQTPAGRDRAVVAVEDGLLLNFGPRTAAVLHLLRGALAEAAE